MRKSDYPTVLRRGVVVMVILLLLFGVFAPAAMAGAWPRCHFDDPAPGACSADDCSITDVWIVADSDCDPGDDTEAELWVKFWINRANGVCCVVSVVDIYVDGNPFEYDRTTNVGELGPGGYSYNRKIADITWDCGSKLTLEDIYVQWIPKTGQDCPICTYDDCTDYHQSSKCYRDLGPYEVDAPLIANFTFDNVCFGKDTTFTDTTTGGSGSYTTYDWDFGDGTPHSSEQNPTHHYDIAKKYTVTLTVTDSDGNIDPQSHVVEVYENPTATALSNSPCVGDTIELYGGPNDMSTYSWTDSGWTSNEQNPTRPDATLAMAGEYTLTVTDANGCTASDDVTVTVVESCVATAPDFSVCEDTTLTNAMFITEGAGCSGPACCEMTLDYSGVDTSVLGGQTYTVTCECPDGICEPGTATGTVTVVESCVATAPDFSVCEDTTLTNAMFITEGAGCSGPACCEMTLDYSGVDTSVLGGQTYTVTCECPDGICEPGTATGTVTVVESCVATAPDFSVCEDTTLTNAMFITEGAGCSGPACCEMTLDYSGVDTSVLGGQTYTVTCECPDGICEPGTATGTVTVVESCVATAPDFSVCEDTTLTNAMFITEGAGCSGPACCEMTLDYSGVDTSVLGGQTYTVTCECPDGICEPGTATGTVTVVESCVATAPDFSVCEDTTLTNAMFITEGAGCSGPACCEMTLDYSGVDTSVLGGQTYTVTCECPDGICEPGTATGTVTVVESCVATAPDFSICQGTTVNDQLFIDHGASCSGGCTVSLSYSVNPNTPGPYTYTVTCVGDCAGDPATGTVTVVESCVATAPDFSICQGTTVNDQLFIDHGASCSGGCTVSLSYSVNPNTPGPYTYTVTCVGDCAGDPATGTVTVVESCVATAPDFSICQGTTVNDLLFIDHGASCSAGCTVSLDYSFDGNTPGPYTYTVTCDGDCGGDPATGTVTVVESCVATAPDFSICQGTTVDDLLFIDHGASCSAGCTVSLTYSFDGSTVGAYTYTVTCDGDCAGDPATGTVTVVESCVATAPDFSICQGTTVNDLLFIDHGASCSAGCTVSLTYSFDGSTVGAYTYTVTCDGDCGGDTDEGTVTVRDCAPPVIVSVTQSNDEPCAGEDVTITAHVTDDAGVTAVTLTYDTTTIPMSMTSGTATDGYWQATIPGQPACTTLTIFVSATDGENTVSSTPHEKHWKDCTPPVIVSVTQSNDEPCAGEDVTITAHVTDDAGVTAVTLTYDTTTIPMSMTSGTATDGYWQATIPGQPACTTLTIFVSATDGENTVSSTPHEKHWKDCTPPVIVSVTQSNDEPCAGEDVTITAHVTDDAGVTAVTLTYDTTTIPMSMTSGTATDGYWEATIPGQPACTTLTIFVSATDGENTVSSTPHEKHWKDCTPPVIVSVTQSNDEPCAGEDVTISAHVTDNVGVTAVNLTYDGTTVPMTLSSGTAKEGNWTAIIPGQPACTTLTIFVTATDGENTVSSTPHETHWKDCAPVIEKSGSPATVAPGGTVTYTINYTNTGTVPLHNVVITEYYPKGVTFISASPAPDAGTNNVWTIVKLEPGESGTIVIKVKVPEEIDLSFTETGSVIGEGLVMVTKDLSTEQKPYSLRNRVTLSCVTPSGKELAASAFATTKVSGVPGTSLGITESGSGVYSSDEILDLETKNKTIILKKTTHAEYKPTSFNFSDSFSVDFTNKWKQDICSKNMEIDAAIHKKISDATYIDDETISRVDKDKSTMSFDSSFNGSMYIGARTKDTAISETYIGEFDVLQTIQIAKGPIPTPAPTPTPTPIWLPCPYNDSQGNTTEDAEPTP